MSTVRKKNLGKIKLYTMNGKNLKKSRETTVSTLLSSSPGTHADPQSDAGSTLPASPATPWTCEDWWQGVCTGPQTQPTDTLLNKHRGKKDILRSMQQCSTDSSTDPDSVLHSTTKLHVSQYVKHLAKLQNTSSSLNNSRETS
ncbi:hypothetical protein G5714_002517 [Onychostoma macrolepis]|uniref:Uncharacterized protein n=1 Tax=Onychostoma macrolepis TaxID=369639 RepID=A0A7J6D6Y0_9TELE|nr:hypothetical protein G5714_002517 [Onychostoma macrolepis]